MRQNYKFYDSVMPLTAAPVRHDLFEKSIEAFEKQEYRNSLLLLLDFIHPDWRSKDEDTSGNSFHIPHGPVVFHLQYENEYLNLSVPFAELSEKNRIALLRLIASLNFSDLDLARLLLKKDRLYFSYMTPVKYGHPRKIYHILEEICAAVDRHSYRFFSQFGCRKIEEKTVSPYKREAVTYIYEAIQQSCREGLEALAYFESARRFNEMWNILTTLFLQIDYIAHPQGELKDMLDKAIRDMDRDMPLSLLIADGKQTLRNLQAKTRKQIGENLYYTETFIPDKRQANLQDIRDNSERCYKEATREMVTKDYRNVCLRITHKFYEIYYYNRLEKELNDKLQATLQQASAQPWEKAAFLLYTTLENIMKASPAEQKPAVAA